MMMINRRRKKVVFILFVIFLLAFAGCDSTSEAVTADEGAEESPSAEEASESEAEQELTLDGSDTDSFDASWKAITEEMSEEEKSRFDVAMLAALYGELEPEDEEDAVDSSEALDELDGETTEQIYARAEVVMDGSPELDEVTPELAEEIYEAFGLEADEELAVAAVVDVMEAEFGEDEVDEPELAPDERFSATVSRLTQMIETYYVSYGGLPESLTELAEGDSPLIEEVPQDPWGNDYIYEVHGERDFSITSKGADGVEGTGEDLEFEY